MATTWQAKAAVKRGQLGAAIPKEWTVPPAIFEPLKKPLDANKNNLIELGIVQKTGLLTEKELAITENYNVPQLLEALAAGTLSSLEVTVAFSKRAAIAQQLTACLTEVFFDQAQERARSLDAMQSKGQLAGPLHGLPISLKDSFQVKGVQATLGLVSFLDDKPAETNSPLVDILLELGAVIYVKTNIPQTLMTADSDNNVFGHVLNPWNTMLGAGGSSGGEGALVAFRGSPLGVGTDVGGSIRIPSLCCGVYGFKPTSSRVPYGGQRGCGDPGLKVILAAAGPMANDVHALEIFVKSVLDKEPAKRDSTAIDVPWRSEVAAGAQFKDRKLRLGVLAVDPVYPLHPPVKRALDEAYAVLRAQGHELIELTPEEGIVAEATEVAYTLFPLDTTGDSLVKAGGEPAIPSRIRIDEEMKRVAGLHVPDLGDKDGLAKLATLVRMRLAVMAHWVQIWSKHKLDAVIGPGAQNTAVEHDMYGLQPYTTFLNTLDYPAAILPISKAVTSTSDKFEIKEHQAGPAYHPEILEGAPCTIEVFTSRMRDEECIAIAKIVDAALHTKV